MNAIDRRWIVQSDLNVAGSWTRLMPLHTWVVITPTYTNQCLNYAKHPQRIEKTMEGHGRALKEEVQFCMSWFTMIYQETMQFWALTRCVRRCHAEGKRCSPCIETIYGITPHHRLYIGLFYILSWLPPIRHGQINKHHECESPPVDRFPCHVPIKIDHYIWI